MKVIVFGATGTLGKIVTRQLAQQGHVVTAFARNAENAAIDLPAVRGVSGDALDAQAVAKALEGHDAVVVTLGAGMNRRSRIRSQGTLNIIRGMQQHGVRRLICQSTLGAHESWGNLNFFWKRIMFGALLRPVFQDHELQEQLVRASGLDWTIVRPSAFDTGPATGGYREGFAPSERRLSLKIPLGDIAAFLARQLAEAQYLHRAVGISN
ncbi:NAD(P)-dependent oxidoreductase [uncultured Roseobacter sp.]|uniref:NAD(P)-dependent oxidoreductase n=1 Tax=uncultured Roseobacter sp. TaxID=114847 RepID=UPI002634D2E2|nr:SDR family oxidoreductase [uncultured Roseobacter sp.]